MKFQHEILQHRSREERTERVTAMEKIFRKKLHSRLPLTYIKKYGRQRLERRWCAKESPKTLFCCGCEKRRNYHRTFTSKAVAGVFAVYATGKYTVASVSAEREHVEWRGV